MKQGMSHLFAIPFNWEQVVYEITRLLSGAGLQVIRSFDLQSARAAHQGVLCPQHGTETCTCQLIVLLVYGYDRSPVTLFVHGCDDQTWVSMVNQPEQHADARQELSILRMLSPANFSFEGQEGISAAA